MRFLKFHLCGRCLMIALGILAAFMKLAHADAKMVPSLVASTAAANAGVADDLPDFSAPAPAIAVALPLVSDKSDIQAAPSDINKDTQLMLGAVANPSASIKPAPVH